MDGYLYAGMVMENELLEQVPAISTARIDTADRTYRFTNHPANLFGLAVMDHFRDFPDKGQAFMWRFLAIPDRFEPRQNEGVHNRDR
jgi:hypothetical protein